MQTASVLNVVGILTVAEMNNVVVIGAKLVTPVVRHVGLVILTRIAETPSCMIDVVTERARRVMMYALIKRPLFVVRSVQLVSFAWSACYVNVFAIDALSLNRKAYHPTRGGMFLHLNMKNKRERFSNHTSPKQEELVKDLPLIPPSQSVRQGGYT